jgi:hypothetical protein
MGKVADRLRQIAKIAVAKYVTRSGDLLVAYPNRSGATVLVKKSGTKYEIVSLKQNRIWGSYAISYAQAKGVAGIVPNIRLRDVTNEAAFLEVLENPSRVLKGDLMQDIAQLSKILGKLKYYEVVDEAKALKLLTLKESIPVAYLKRYLPELPTDQEGSHQKIGPFDVSFDHENEGERQAIENLIERAVQTLGSAGFGDYLYGKIFVVSKLKGRTVADYHPSDDSIRLSHKAKGKEDLRTFIHEIGHRILNKGGADYPKIKAKFREAVQGFSLEVKPGTILKDKKDGKTYKYVGQSFQARSTPYKIKQVLTENGETIERGDYRVSAFYFTNFEGDFKINGEWFPTAYSKTNQEEWFCEILSFALTRGDKIFLDFIKEVRK